MRVAVVQFAGTNCEYDTEHAFRSIGADVEIVWHKDTTIDKSVDLIVLAGGFSYGDALRSGAIARFSPIVSAIKEHAVRGTNILGICNGFQILTELGLLEGALMRNENLHFISRYHYIRVESSNNTFLSATDDGELLHIPIAHHDGNYFADLDTLKSMYDNEQVILKYCNKDAKIDNPNGSVDSIAGICNKSKNIFALMPHPERAMEQILGSNDGVKMLQGFCN